MTRMTGGLDLSNVGGNRTFPGRTDVQPSGPQESHTKILLFCSVPEFSQPSLQPASFSVVQNTSDEQMLSASPMNRNICRDLSFYFW